MVDSTTSADGESKDCLALDDITTYTAPRGKPPHPDDTPLDPYDGRKLVRQLEQYPSVEIERELKMVAGSIRSAEASLNREAGKTTQSPGSSDPRNPRINKQREMVRNPAGYPAAKRAESHQQNVRTHYRDWANLCERYFRLVRRAIEDADDDTTPAGT